MSHAPMSRWIATLFASAGLAACSTVGAGDTQAANASPQCAPLAGSADIARDAEGKILILGELHGTAESSAAVGEFVCSVATEGPVLVAIEWSVSREKELMDAWALPQEAFSEALLAIEEWRVRKDGWSSVATYNFLMRIHGLKDAGADIDIFPFSGFRNPEEREQFADLRISEQFEALGAKNLGEAAARRPYRHVVTLVGDAHASKRLLNFESPPYRAMAMILAETENVVSLDLRHSGGAAWNCVLKPGAKFEPGKQITPEDEECSAHELRGHEGYEGRPEMALWSDDGPPPVEGFDGYYFVGTISASPPKLQAAAK